MRRNLLTLCLLLSPLTGAQRTEVVGYLPHYRVDSLNALPYDSLTDVIFFSVEPKVDGSIDSFDAKPAILKKLRALTTPKGVKLHLCVGGWRKSKGFSKMAANLSTRTAFVRNLTAFLKTHQLDGADLDWEHPRSKSETVSFQKLIIELKTVFRPHDLELTVTVAGWGTYLHPETVPFVDRIQIMAYDQGTPHASFENAVKAIETWRLKGVPTEKLILGLPLYGRNRERVARSYARIIEEFDPPPSSDEAGGFHFNGIDTLTRKIRFVRKKGLAGVMFWELGQDAKGKNSVVRTLPLREDFSENEKEKGNSR
ncbi:MAG: glycoside hydrolase family 18 protein [Verrucomicrobiota bacterium]|nr:glycoside hydrolase family 18 protein [Verrucomicrobiota bacterium]